MTQPRDPLPPIAILGAGSMGGAVAQGLSASGLAAGGILATNRTAARARTLDGLAGLAGATITGEQLYRLAPALAAHLQITVDE